MILKSGLLYASEGKYGFLHLTFQEYLAAAYYARSPDQNTIADYIDKGFWIETLRLFVNIGNTNVFFRDMIERAKSGNLKDIHFLLELAREIVTEEERQKYVGEITDLLLPKLLDYKNDNKDSEQVLKTFYPSLDVYLIHQNKKEDLFLKIFLEGENYFARSLALIVISNCDISIRRQVFKFVKKDLEDVERRFLGFEKQAANIVHQKQNINVRDAERIIQKKENDLEQYVATVYFTLFSIYAVKERNLESFCFLINKVNSPIPIVKYLALITLRHYPYTEELARKLGVNYLAILKPADQQEKLLTFRLSELKTIGSVETPREFSAIAEENSYLYWKELRPAWQIEQLLESFRRRKKLIAKYKDDFTKVSEKMGAAIKKMPLPDRSKIFINN